MPSSEYQSREREELDIIAVDDKRLPLEALTDAIRKAAPEARVRSFRNAADALAAVEEDPCDVAFVDIDMPGTNGIELARSLKAINPLVNIVFATGYSEYASTAFGMHASGYLMKPVEADAVRAELDDLRHPVAHEQERGLYVRCFGSFAAFCDGEPLHFERMKTLELLALLVDRNGGLCSTGEIAEVLWEGGPLTTSHRAYARTLVADLRHTLERLGCADVLVRRRGYTAVDPSKFACDYYDFLAGNPQAINAYRGEYMNQFSWAEETLGKLIARQ